MGRPAAGPIVGEVVTTGHPQDFDSCYRDYNPRTAVRLLYQPPEARAWGVQFLAVSWVLELFSLLPVAPD
jgi:hypothetical protein